MLVYTSRFPFLLADTMGYIIYWLVQPVLVHSNHSIQFTCLMYRDLERLTEGVVDLTVRMEFSAAVPANTQAYVLVIGDRMLKFKSDGSKMSVLF